MSQFILNEIINPFHDELRKGNPNVLYSGGMEVPDEESMAFKLESDINFMKLLKRPELIRRYKSKKVRIQKHAAGFTECGSANDIRQLHKNTKIHTNGSVVKIV